MSGIAPQDRGAAFRRNYRIDRVFEHQDLIAGGERDRPARAALPDHRGDKRHPDVESGLDRPRDRFGLTALLGVDARIVARGIDKAQHWEPETIGKPHQPARLAIPLGPGHAEIMSDPPLRIAALFGAENDHAAAAE